MNEPPQPLLSTLADFRFTLRRFLHFSETAAGRVGLHAQQHQLLLQVAGAPPSVPVTIAYAASRLGLKHNSVVELVNRSEKAGLLRRIDDPRDSRRVLLQSTERGGQLLRALAQDHARELGELAPALIETLGRIHAHASTLGEAEATPAGEPA